MKKLAVVLVFLTYFLSGCATIISGEEQTLTFNSTPEGASVYLDGRKLGVTPLTMKLRRSDLKPNQGMLEFRKEGFESANVQMFSETNPVVLVNGVFCCILTSFSSTATDHSTGAMYRYNQESYVVDLTPVGKKRNKNAALRKFILTNYDELTRDIRAQKGKYVGTLFQISAKRYDFVELNRIMEKANGDANVFYRELVTL